MRRTIRITARLLVGGVFLLAFSYKLAEPSAIPGLLSRLPLLPDMSLVARQWASRALIGVEGALGIALLLDVWSGATLLLSAGLFLGFAVLVGPHFDELGGDCSCFWKWMPWVPGSGASLVARNMTLAAVALIGHQVRGRAAGRSAARLGEHREAKARWRSLPWVLWVGGFGAVLFASTGGDGSPPRTEAPYGSVLVDATIEAKPQQEGGLLDPVPAGVARHQASETGTHEEQAERPHILLVDGEGTPVAGAGVFLLDHLIVLRESSYGLDPRPRPEPEWETDADGILPLTPSLRGSLLAFKGDGLAPRWMRVPREPDQEHRVTLERPLGGSLLVQDADGIPVPGARILASAKDWGLPGMESGAYMDVGSTDRAGRLALDPTGPACSGLVIAEGFCPQRVELGRLWRAAPQAVVPITLLPGAPVEGSVLGASEEDRLRVVCEDLTSAHGQVFAVAVGEDGRFRFPALRAETEWLLTPCRDAASGPEPCGESVRVTPPELSVRLSMEDGVTVRLRALTPEGEAVAAGVYLSLLSGELLANPEGGAVRREADGGLVWSNVPCPGPTRGGNHDRPLWVRAPGLAPLFVGTHDLEPGSTVDLGTVPLHKADAWQVAVRSRAEEKPVEGASVRYVPASVVAAGEENSPWTQVTPTDAAGLAHLLSPPTVDGYLDVRAEGFLPLWERVSDTCGGTCEVLLDRPAHLIVHCEGWSGEPARGACVERQSVAGSRGVDRGWTKAYSDAEGTIELEVTPGDVALRYAPGALRGDLGSRAELTLDLPGTEEGQPHATEPVIVEGLLAGEEREVTLHVGVLPELTVFVESGGDPLGGMRVVAVPGSQLDVVDNDLWGGFDLPRGLTSEQGTCVLSGIPLGITTLACIEPASRVTSFVVIRADHEVGVPVTIPWETRTVTVKALARDGQPIEGMRVRLEQVSVQAGMKAPGYLARTPGGREVTFGAPRRGYMGVTGRDGTAEFPDVPIAARFRVWCDSPKEFPLVAPGSIDVGAADVDVTLRDLTAASLEVHVFDRQGAPLADRPALLKWTDRSARPRRLTARTDQEGMLRFSGLEPGQYQVILESGAVLPVVLAAGEMHEGSLVGT